MSIKVNISQGVDNLSAAGSDTVLFSKGDRSGISAMSIHNTSAASRVVWIYISGDATSANGKRVAVYSIRENGSEDINELAGQAIATNEQIIAVQKTTGAAAGDLNCKLSYMQFTGSS